MATRYSKGCLSSSLSSTPVSIVAPSCQQASGVGVEMLVGGEVGDDGGMRVGGESVTWEIGEAGAAGRISLAVGELAGE